MDHRVYCLPLHTQLTRRNLIVRSISHWSISPISIINRYNLANITLKQRRSQALKSRWAQGSGDGSPPAVQGRFQQLGQSPQKPDIYKQKARYTGWPKKVSYILCWIFRRIRNIF